MILEMLATASMAGIAASSYHFKNKESTNDHERIKLIADTIGLRTKEESIRIYRRDKKDNHTEYIYKIPLGLSFKQFEDNKQVFIDGLNNKSRTDFNLENLKNINWKKNPLKQAKRLYNTRTKLDKQIEMEYDGMLRMRVYEKGLDTNYKYSDELAEEMEGWQIPVGYTFKSLVTHDFEKRSNMIVAGTAGFGKSKYLRLLISSLIKQKPEQTKLHLIDLKAGVELGIFKDLKQTEQFGKTAKEAKEILQEVQQNMEETSDWMFDNGINDVKHMKQNERHFIIIDEAASLDDDSKDIVVDIARRGRAAGYRIVYATQYPTNQTLPSQVRANIGARVCFRLETSAQSRAVLDEDGAENLPEIAGRAIFRRVSNYIVQTPYIENKDINRIIKPYIKEVSNASGKSEKSPKAGSDTIKFEKA